MALISSSCSRTPTKVPLVGDRFHRGVVLTLLAFFILLCYHKYKPDGSANFRPALTPATGVNQMAKAKRVHSTPRQTAQKPVTRDEPMKAPGCHWEFWNGAIGLSTDLSVFEAGDEVGTASNLPDSERIALANYMIDLWTQVRDQHHNAPNETSVDGDVQAGRESLARLSLDIEEDVMNLCRAVNVVSSVITDQLADPLSGHR